MSSIWCLDCKNYGGGNTCYVGRDPERDGGICVWYENIYEDKNETEYIDFNSSFND